MPTHEDNTPAIDLATLYTPGQLDVITQLLEIQEGLKLSDEKFASRHLTTSTTSWFRLRKGEYRANVDSAFVKLESDLRNYRLELAQSHRLTGGRAFHLLASHKQVLDAVTICKLKPDDDPNRFIAYLANTGGGKTTLGRQLKIQHNGIFLEGRESWRRSYLAALCDIALAAGVREVESMRSKGEREVEQALFAKLNANRRVLILDEGEYFGPRTINLVKEILNLTPTTVVLFSIPALFAWWQRKAWEQAKQINRRAEAIIEADGVMPEDVKVFLKAEKIVIEGDAAVACGDIAGAANSFGLYDMVVRVIKFIREDNESVATNAEVRAAIANAKRMLNRRA